MKRDRKRLLLHSDEIAMIHPRQPRDAERQTESHQQISRSFLFPSLPFVELQIFVIVHNKKLNTVIPRKIRATIKPQFPWVKRDLWKGERLQGVLLNTPNQQWACWVHQTSYQPHKRLFKNPKNSKLGFSKSAHQNTKCLRSFPNWLRVDKREGKNDWISVHSQDSQNLVSSR